MKIYFCKVGLGMRVTATPVILFATFSAWGSDKILNFLPDPDAYPAPAIPQGYYIECNRGGADAYCERGVGSDPDTTAFLKEYVIIDDGFDDSPYAYGQYQHMIIGLDPGDGDGFVQETYIRSIYTVDAQNITEYAGGSTSDTVSLTAGFDTSLLGLSSSGNATGNPVRILVRQKINDGSMKSDFIKDSFDRKPVIKQTITSPHAGVTMVSTFNLDMSNSNYSTDTATAILQNDLTFSTGGPGEFTMELYDSADINLDAGRYIYTDGPGMFGSEGIYIYRDSSLDPTTIDWLEYDDGSNW